MNSVIFAAAVVFWLCAWAFNEWLVRRTFASASAERAARIAVPVLFGVAILVLWEGIVCAASTFPRCCFLRRR